jgi:6-pyruvoyltetrahydropterin/6-carboxytetrahydropterin synthase
MYTIAVKRDFIAQHYLIGGDWGAENELHSHHYRIELQLAGQELDQHGYLVDILDIENILNSRVAHYQDRTLNEMPEFDGLNPSIEHFARILCESISAQIQAVNIQTVTVKLWENEIAWAQFTQERKW